MNKSELLKFSVEARRDLIEKISRKAKQYGITEDNQDFNMKEEYGQLIVNDKVFPVEKRHALNTFQGRLRAIGYQQLIEETAYTWFNRIIAIRYMEVNNYLPDRVNVLSSATGKSEPDILSQYETMNIDVNHEEINEYIQKGQNEQAYRRLFIAQCNALSRLLPTLFEEIEDYAELLLPDYLLDQESIILKIVNDLSDSNFYELLEDGTKKDNVEVLGWLYQYYMSERKEKVGGLKNTAVKKEDLPVVTQLFTPKWIVQYMLQNSLGKIYDEKYEGNQLANHWEYYLKHEENHHLYPEFESLEDLKITDPACGSGHILVYAFDMLYDMYEEAGYPSREIPQLILEKNLYGLDIDKRAQQISNFALLMKAAEKQPRFISRLSRRGIVPKLNVYEIVDADQDFPEEVIDFFVKDETEKSLIIELVEQFENGKQFGSLITPIGAPYEEWINRIYRLEEEPMDLIEESYVEELKAKLLPVLRQAYLLHQKYDVVVTNPPYHNKFNPKLKKFMNTFYNDYKSDMYSAFIYRSMQMIKENGYSTLMTPFTWMYISRHRKLREIIISNTTIASLIELDYSGFKEASVPICTFVLHNQDLKDAGEFLSLSKGNQRLQVSNSASSTRDNRKTFKTNYFKKIPNCPISYWATDTEVEIFNSNPSISDFATTRIGLVTGKNDKFIRFWYEIGINDIQFNIKSREQGIESGKKWFPHNKPDGYRKWSGDDLNVINWENDGYDIRNFKNDKGRVRSHNYNLDYIFKPAVLWNKVTSAVISAKYSDSGFLYDEANPFLTTLDKDENLFILGFINSKVATEYLKIINPTLNFQPGNIGSLPLVNLDKRNVVGLVSENIKISQNDWDSQELSRNFKTHPLISYRDNHKLISSIFSEKENKTKILFDKIKQNEEKLNEIFIDAYGLTDILTHEVSPEYISLSVTDNETEAKAFMSFFIGCLMGRYSLDVEGLAYAGGHFDESKYETFKPNPSGLVFLTDDHYFDNDIIVRLKEFLSVAFSPNTVNENIEWLAESLKMKKDEAPEDRLRRYFLDEFFKDHCQTYKKHPIYWLVDSGRQKGLRTLVYMHRYQEDTMATIRFEHLQEIQEKYQNEIEMLDTRIVNPSLTTTAKRELERSKNTYQRKVEELQEFDKHLATYANLEIPIDLDDGVKVNYAKFDKVLAKIR